MPLHTQSALIKNLQPVRSALMSLVGGDFPTYVWKAEDRQMAGFIQIHVEEDSHHGHILYLSANIDSQTPDKNGPAPASNGRSPLQAPSALDTAWLPLLDQAVADAGRRGMHSLVAEVNELGGELPVLRRAGFAVYTRQDVWKLSQAEAEERSQLLMPRESSDDWEIQLLYANIVPRLVQLVEPVPPLYDGQGWVLREGDELGAFVHIHDGPAATWMRLFVHPNSETDIDEIIRSAIYLRPPTPEHPLYCCVRRYQSWVQNSLTRHGFTLWGSQAVMVKHTVHHLPKSAPDLAKVVEAKGVSPSAPIMQRYQQTSSQNGARHKQA